MNSYHDLLCIAHAMGLQVVEAIIEDDRLGSYQHNRRRITLDERLTDNQKRVTLQHEIIHAEHWHDGISQLLSHDVEEQKTRRETALRLIDPQEYAHAEEFQAALEDDIRRGRYVDPNADQRLFQDVASQWIETKLDVKPATLGRYQRELRVYINPTWGGKTLREITPNELQSWVNKLSKGGYKAELPGKRKPRPLSPRSIRNIVKVVMAAVFEYAITNKWIRENPAKLVTTPRIVSKDEDMVFLTVPEVELLADEAAAKGRDVDGLLVRFLAYTGVRINEALALQIQDLDFRNRKARIRRTWSDDGEGKMQLGTPKSGEARTIALPPSLIPQLEEQAAGQSKNEFLFRAKRGGYIHDHSWRTRIWYPSVRNAGMEGEGANIHSLRHTYASIAIACGADVKTLQKQLGHATASITLDVYAGLWPERLNEVADAVDQMRLKAIDTDKPTEFTAVA